MLKLNLRATSSLGTSDEFPFQPSFFSKSPFRSFFFVGDTLLLILTLAILGFVVVGHWPRLPAISVYWLCLVGFSMIAIWVLALRCYLRMHEVYRGGTENSIRDGSLLGVIMSSAASMIQWGLFFAFLMTGGVLMQLDRALSGR